MKMSSGPNDRYTCFCGKVYGPYSNSRGAYKRHLMTTHKGESRARKMLASLGGGHGTKVPRAPSQTKPPKRDRIPSQPKPPKPPSVPDVFEIPEKIPEKPAEKEKEQPVGFAKKPGADGAKKTYPIFARRPPPLKVFRPERTSAYERTIPSAIPMATSPHAGTDSYKQTFFGGGRTWRHATDDELRQYAKVSIPENGPIGLDYDGNPSGNANLIWWRDIQLNAPEAWPPEKRYRDEFEDFAQIDTPYGTLYELRNALMRNRASVCMGRKPVNVLLQGPPGTGKTVAVKAFAAETGLPYFFIPANPETMGKEELLGRIELKGGSSVWRDGTIAQAARYGGILHIDELSLLDPEVQQVMHEMLDSSRRITLTSENGEVIRCHPDLFVVATMNPEEIGTIGVKALSEPMRRRFTTFFMDYPPMGQELKIVKKTLKFSDSELEIPQNPATQEGIGKYGKDIIRFMRAVKEIRETAREEQSVRFVPTISEAIDFAECLKIGRSRDEALHVAVVGKYIGQEREKIEESLRKQWNDYKSDMRTKEVVKR